MEQILLQMESLQNKSKGKVNDFELKILYTDDKRVDNRVIDIAERFNVSENCVIRHLKNLELFKWRDSLKNPLNKRILKMYNEGLSQQMIFEQLSKEGYKRVGQANISRRLKNGVLIPEAEASLTLIGNLLLTTQCRPKKSISL